MKNSINPDKLMSDKGLETGTSDSGFLMICSRVVHANTSLFFIIILFILNSAGYGAQSNRPSVVIEQDGVTLSIRADRIEGTTEEVLTAAGNVIAEYGDTRLSAEKITYNKKDELLIGEGDLLLARGVTWLKGSPGQDNCKGC